MPLRAASATRVIGPRLRPHHNLLHLCCDTAISLLSRLPSSHNVFRVELVSGWPEWSPRRPAAVQLISTARPATATAATSARLPQCKSYGLRTGAIAATVYGIRATSANGLPAPADAATAHRLPRSTAAAIQQWPSSPAAELPDWSSADASNPTAVPESSSTASASCCADPEASAYWLCADGG